MRASRPHRRARRAGERRRAAGARRHAEQLKADGAQGLRASSAKGAALAALEAQAFHVHIRDGEGALAGEALVFGEQAAVS